MEFALFGFTLTLFSSTFTFIPSMLQALQSQYCKYLQQINEKNEQYDNKSLVTLYRVNNVTLVTFNIEIVEVLGSCGKKLFSTKAIM